MFAEWRMMMRSERVLTVIHSHLGTFYRTSRPIKSSILAPSMTTAIFLSESNSHLDWESIIH